MSALFRNFNFQRVTKKSLLLVEGPQDALFFDALLGEMSIVDEIQIVAARGKGNFPSLLDSISADREVQSGNLKKLGIVHDADNDANEQWKCLCEALKSIGLPVPAQVGRAAHGNGLNLSICIVPPGSSRGSI